jgi:hypothetical protein
LYICADHYYLINDVDILWLFHTFYHHYERINPCMLQRSKDQWSWRFKIQIWDLNQVAFPFNICALQVQ